MNVKNIGDKELLSELLQRMNKKKILCNGSLLVIEEEEKKTYWGIGLGSNIRDDVVDNLREENIKLRTRLENAEIATKNKESIK